MRRQLALAAVLVAGAAVAGGVTYFVTRPQHAALKGGVPRIGAMNLDISLGTTPAQLVSKLGPPAAKSRTCWTYRGSGNGKVAGIFAADSVDAVRFCFMFGIVETIQDHASLFTSPTGSHWVAPIFVDPNPPHIVQSCYSPTNCS